MLDKSSEFFYNLTNISPIFTFDVERLQTSSDIVHWIMQTVDTIYEYHIEWDAVNQ